ncbi:2Fe-2S iron-sulfur cluster binding domain-containing protein [Natronomonas salina]|uniref:ferredoxin Fer n=1 Tax=Natronomonas salina TaxID=1710540 RepID=UPI0015B6D6A6|nr:ferredoxin Fer [Natronomonas salina]QLD90186.1 2Fe-2S iron-sulfur cluster binding domain-containing protein [Natronomonas salina]
MESPFEVLGVEPDADEEAIEHAYRSRVKESHPDHGGSPEEFKRVRAAYEAIVAGDVDREQGAQLDRPDGATAPDPNRWYTGSGTAESEAEAEPEPERSRVEYLNFECLEDHGWSLEDDDLFEKAADADLATDDYGRFLVEPDETLLEAAENRGFAWPFACRGGACANCAVAVTEGELSQPVDHILPEEMTDRGLRLSCVGRPTSERLKVVYNVKYLPDLDELRLPPRPFDQAQAD